ncbi:OsmC family protein [Photobacterium sp. ZSDE20]|nr:OsmC family protein [Photobacterium sp. ZSDE20]
MSEYGAIIRWQKAQDEAFSDNQYSRGHTWEFDGGVIVPTSSSPHVVPLPLSVEENVDPEEAFIAAIASCHMLTFLGIAAKQKYVIESYVDDVIGVLEEDDSGRSSVTTVTLRPKIVFIGSKVPTSVQLDKLHHLAHKNCFIANSVKTEIKVEMRD